MNNSISIKENITSVSSNDSLTRTLDIMKTLENESIKDFDFKEFVNNTFAGILNKNDLDKIYFVHKWTNKNIKYKDDDFDETLISPRLMIFIRQGDCDDFALFIKTVLSLLNVKTNYILLAKENKQFSHIAVCYNLQNKPLFIDGTQKNNVILNKYLYYKIVR